MEIQHFYDQRTSTLTYVVFDAITTDAVVIDPVLDYDPVGSKVWTESVDAVLGFCAAHNLKVHYVLETHAHADHLSGAQKIKARHPGAKTAIGEGITIVQRTFKDVFELPADFPTDGRQFDVLLGDGQALHAGSLFLEVAAVPGHTPACVVYRCNDVVFTGDALFMPDQGTGRCDFPAGSASDLYDSIQRIYSYPDETRVFVGHDYQPEGRDLAWESTVGAQKAGNIQLPKGRSKDEFVSWRTRRDATLSAPRLLFQSVQVNVDGGRIPRFLKVPVNVFRPHGEGALEYGDA